MMSELDLDKVLEIFKKPEDWDSYNDFGQLNLVGYWGERAPDVVPRLVARIRELESQCETLTPSPGGATVLRDALSGRSERIHQERRRDWSRRTFPGASPVASLRHLSEELEEAIAAYESRDLQGLREELADCRLLLDDAIDRAEITQAEHRRDRIGKLEINESRTWAIKEDGSGRHDGYR